MDLLLAAAQDVDFYTAWTAPPRSQEKLGRLSNRQLSELSRDVHDELLRRNLAPGVTNGHESEKQTPVFVDGFHPKRNQARQKLTTLSKPKFLGLVRDAVGETSRRTDSRVRNVSVKTDGVEGEQESKMEEWKEEWADDKTL